MIKNIGQEFVIDPQRRRFLTAFLALTAFPAINGCQKSSLESVNRRPGIDVHCHVFNASDLSVGGFVQRVLLQDYEDQVIFDPSEVQPEGFLQGLAALLIRILSLPAITAEAESKRIKNPVEATSFQMGPTEQSNQIQSILLEVIAPMPAPPGSDDITKFIYDADYSELLKAIRKEISDQKPNVTEEELNNPEALTQILLLSDGFIGRNIRWALNMLSSRREHVDQLINLYGGIDGVRLFTPALVDFEYWLNEAPRSPILDQVEVMDLIQRSQTDISMVHCFAPFDPWRQIIDEAEGNSPTAMEVVQMAVMEAGFVGVKLYPPMGFYPSDNAKHRLSVPERADEIPDFPARIDRALTDLYRWCSQNGVAVMAHAADSNSATDKSGKRANPKWWQPVLENFSSIRLNLGHFGGFDKYFSRASQTSTWEWNVGKLIKSGNRQVFADLSYVSEFLGNNSSPENRQTIKQLLREFIDEFDPHMNHLMYGSDWIMLGREPDYSYYAYVIQNLLTEVGIKDEALENFFVKNAVNYLGLAPGNKTRARMEVYYQKHGMDVDKLKLLAG